MESQELELQRDHRMWLRHEKKSMIKLLSKKKQIKYNSKTLKFSNFVVRLLFFYKKRRKLFHKFF